MIAIGDIGHPPRADLRQLAADNSVNMVLGPGWNGELDEHHVTGVQLARDGATRRRVHGRYDGYSDLVDETVTGRPDIDGCRLSREGIGQGHSPGVQQP